MLNVMARREIQDEGSTIRNNWCLSLGLVALVLVSCAQPGGIYRGYEGPEKNAKDIALLDWSDRTSPWVTHIDSKYLHKSRPSTGLQVTSAQLPPGPHFITIRHNWEDLYYKNLNSRELDLFTNFRPGHSYVTKEDPCRDCDPFTVTFWIEGTAAEAIVSQKTLVGSGPYGEARKEARKKERECEERCEWIWAPCPFFKGETKEDCEARIFICQLNC